MLNIQFKTNQPFFVDYYLQSHAPATQQRIGVEIVEVIGVKG